MLLIARREFVERGRSRVFLGVMIGMVVLILGGMFVANRFAPQPSTARVVVVGGPPGVAQAVEVVARSMALAVEVRAAGSAEEARTAVVDGLADAALVDGKSILADGEPDAALEALLRGAGAAAARAQVAGTLGLDGAQLQALLDPVRVTVVDVSSTGRPDPASDARGAAAFLSVLVLFMSLLIFGQFVGMGVVEEKQTRVAEVVLARVSTASMLVGKVLGIGALGLVQLMVLGVTTMVGLQLFPPAVPGLDVRALGAVAVVWMVLWFVIGYLMYSFIYATLGATVTRTEDLQSLAYVPTLLLVPAYLVVAMALGGSPSPWLVPMSMVPAWSPLIMPFRMVTGTAPAWQVLLSIAGSLAFIALMVWVGSRVYRGAALRTGGRVPLREAWRAG